MPDTTVVAGDRLCLFAAAALSEGSIAGLAWSFDGGETFGDTTEDGVICRVWGTEDTGLQVVVVRAVEATGALSAPESIRVTVNLCRPRVEITGDSTAKIGDTSRLWAVPVALCGGIALYAWSTDSGASYPDTTHLPVLGVVWEPADTGDWWIAVRGIDSLGTVSEPSLRHIRVGACALALEMRCDSAVIWQDSLDVVLSSTDCTPSVGGYFLSIDGEPADSSRTGAFRLGWTVADTGAHTLSAWVIDKWGISSDSVTREIRVTSCRPALRIVADTVVVAGYPHELRVECTPQCGSPLTYFWSFDGGESFSDSTLDAHVENVWQPGDTGSADVVVEAVTDAGVRAAGDSLTVRIAAGAPAVRLTGDTSVTVNDTVVLTAEIVDSSWTIDRFLWYLDDDPTPRTSASREVRLAWGRDGAGEHLVRVLVVDGRGIASGVDSSRVVVLLDMPRVAALRDTTVSASDTVRFVIGAEDSAGAIEQYYWGVNSFGWADSSADSVMRVWHSGPDTVRVVYGARDDDGLVATDTVRVRFNHPPVNPRITTIDDGDTVYMSMAELRAGGCRVRFGFAADDGNGAADTLAYRLELGASPGALSPVYQGTAVTTEITDVDTGTLYWRLVCVDRFGDSAADTGSLRCMARRTICFVGHSIVVGAPGTLPGGGGFRREVLDSMRAFYPPSILIRPNGPVATTYLSPPADDSALAVGGASGGQIFALLNSFASLSSDEWVLMLGVNWQYNATEQGYIANIIDTLHKRNPDAPIHVINGLKCPDSYYWQNVYLPGFNTMLSDTVDSKQTQGWDIHLIDAYTSFMDGGVRNAALFNDDLHPNAEGHAVIARLILQAMGIVP